MLFTTYLAKRLILTDLKYLLWLTLCISGMSGSWVLWAFHSLAFEDKVWPKNVQLDQSAVNSEFWDHHNHAVKNVITFEDMQEDRTPWVIMTLKNIFFSDLHVFSERAVHYMEASRQHVNQQMWFCWEHPTLGQVYTAVLWVQVPQGTYLLPDPFSMQYLNVFSGIMTCTIPGASPWACFM